MKHTNIIFHLLYHQILVFCLFFFLILDLNKSKPPNKNPTVLWHNKIKSGRLTTMSRLNIKHLERFLNPFVETEFREKKNFNYSVSIL